MRILIALTLIGSAGLFGCAARSSEQRQINALLDRMSDAASRGDAEAWLALSDPADPHFATEQRAWAAGLAAKRPAGLSFAPVGRVTLDADGATAPVRARWRPEPDGPSRTVRFTARFSPVVAGLDHAEPAAWRYADAAWAQTADASGRIRVLAPESLAPQAALVRDAMARVTPVVDALFGPPTRPPPPVKLYATVEQLQLSITPTYDAPLGGWNEPGESIKVLWRDGRDADSIERLLAHEYAHSRHFEMVGPHDTTPWWAYEGIAEVAASRVHDRLKSTDERLRGLAGKGELAPFATLAVFSDDTFASQRLAYPQGHHFLSMTERRFGPDEMLAWLAAMGAGASLDEATLAVLGVGFAELDATWRSDLARP